jgi:hypothetical protein
MIQDNDCYLECVLKLYFTKYSMLLKDIPEPKLIMLDGGKTILQLRVREFLQARSLVPKSEKVG